MRRRIRKRSPNVLLLTALILALPGLFLLFRDIVRPSPEAVASRAENWREHVGRVVRTAEVDPALVLAIIAVESKGNPRARSPKGARGLMQLMPATAREQASRLGLAGYSDDALLDPETNVLLGTAYFRRQLRSFEGDERLALAAYNAGPGNLRRWLRETAVDASPGVSPGDPPAWEALSRLMYAQTKSYVENVLRYRDLIAGHLGAGP